MTITPAIHTLDHILLDGMSADDRSDFIKYMAELDTEHEGRGKPYGDGSLWKLTGALCWFDYFNDGESASAAMDEDMSYAD